MSYIRILLVEDHPQMQDAIVALLNQYCTVVGTAERGDSVLAIAAELRPDVVVLDISLPGQSGLQLLPELRNRYPSVGIVMCTSRDQPVFRDEAARRGADGYVLKDRAARELWPAIQEAALIRCAGDASSAGRAAAHGSR